MVVIAVVAGFALIQAKPLASDTGMAAYTATAPPEVTRGIVDAYIVGDSFVAGTGAMTSKEHLGEQLHSYLNWDVTVDAVGGSGFVNKGVPPEGKAEGEVDRSLPTRIDALVAAAPDVLIVAAGRNDIYISPRTVKPVIDTYFDQVRAALPDTKIIVVGAWHWDTTNEQPLAASCAAVDVMLEQASARIGANFVPSSALAQVDDTTAATALFWDAFHPAPTTYVAMGKALAVAAVAAGAPRGPERWRETAFNSNEFRDYFDPLFGIDAPVQGASTSSS
jgi:lysophospholipase L1-like esterase